MTRRVQPLLFGASMLIALAGAVIHFVQPDALAFITVFPVGCWWALGMLPAAIASRGLSRWQRLLLISLWSFVIFANTDTPLALLRRPGKLPAANASKSNRSIRVITFNTGSEPFHSAEELAQWSPDLVLLQESYPRDVVASLADKLFGERGNFAWNGDTAIIARGEVRQVSVDQALPYCLAEVQWEGGPTVRVASLRLASQPVRFDCWSPDCWQTFAEIRRGHRRELQELLADLEKESPLAPALLGGDFNAPARDAIFRLLWPNFTEAFAAAGRGWGCTLPNDLPLLRIDQIWATPSLSANACWSAPSKTSDHRLVIADYQLPAK